MLQNPNTLSQSPQIPGGDSSPNSWLTSEEVMQMLSISRRTLQSYRDKGILGFSAIGGKFYYRISDIHEHLERHYQPPFRPGF